MAKQIARGKRSKKVETLPLGPENFMIMGLGVLVIIAGYIALAIGPIEGFLPLVLAPILLVLGYCVIIPVGILFKKSYIQSANSSQTPSQV
ncbi:MAG: hypothetical protein C4326_11230 [Ignavibacteria bacterium]